METIDTIDTIEINKNIETNTNLSGNTVTNDTSIDNKNNANKTDKPEKPDKPEETSTIFKSIFSASNFILIIWFLGIYFIAYFILGFFFKSSSPSSNEASMARTIDILMFSCLIIVIITSYYSMTDYQKDNFLNATLTKLV